jgi:hypothetical protein
MRHHLPISAIYPKKLRVKPFFRQERAALFSHQANAQ